MNHWREHVSFWLQVFQEWLREPLFYVFLVVIALLLVTTCAPPRFLPFILKSLRRNIVRTALTSMAIVFLVLVVTAIWTVLKFMNEITQEKARDFKVIVTERWQIPSQMPYTYYGDIARGPAKSVEDKDRMAWAFYGGTIDPTKMDWSSQLFFFSMEPNKFMSMMDGVDELTSTQREKLAEALKAMELDKRKCLIGAEKLKTLNKRVG